MAFISGPRCELIYEYTRLKKFKGKFLIPIGPQELRISAIEERTSQKGNQMLVLTIRKDPEETEERKLNFHPMTLYYTAGRLQELHTLVLSAFGKKINTESIEAVIIDLRPLKGVHFHCVVLHKKRLMMRDGKPAERRYLKSTEELGLPIIMYEPQLWKIDIKPIILEPEQHKLLIQPFNREEQDIFNETLLKRYLNQLEL